MTDVRCILCGEAGSLCLKLCDGDTFTCGHCSEEFTTDDVREQMEAWETMLKWARKCPVREEAGATA